MRHRKRRTRDDRCARMRDDGKARGKKGRGLRSEVRCQKTESREKGIEIRGRRSEIGSRSPEGRNRGKMGDRFARMRDEGKARGQRSPGEIRGASS